MRRSGDVDMAKTRYGQPCPWLSWSVVRRVSLPKYTQKTVAPSAPPVPAGFNDTAQSTALHLYGLTMSDYLRQFHSH